MEPPHTHTYQVEAGRGDHLEGAASRAWLEAQVPAGPAAASAPVPAPDSEGHSRPVRAGVLALAAPGRGPLARGLPAPLLWASRPSSTSYDSREL